MGEDDGETRWLSYAELAKARGISKSSATRLAFRRRWARQIGNDGTARVAVPVRELEAAPDAKISALQAEVAALQARVADLTEQMAAVREERAAALARAEELRAVVDRLTAWPGASAWARLRRLWPAR
jgi:outer membrane murein-binding lipoprotein Lpp